jgi:hypothetical protein
MAIPENNVTPGSGTAEIIKSEVEKNTSPTASSLCHAIHNA